MIIIGLIIGLLIAYYIKKPYRKIALDILNSNKTLTKNEIKAEAVKKGKSPRIMWNIYRQEAKKYNRHMKKLNK